MNTWELSDLECFDHLVLDISQAFLNAPRVQGNSWQSTQARKEMLTSYELRHTLIHMPVAEQFTHWATVTGANLPWAEDHFLERVSGQPLNPPPSEKWWPYAVQGNAEHKVDEQFSHTYPERFWPKFANEGGKCADSERVIAVPIVGVRYEYGDLWDVVAQLIADPMTRQAYLPVWFPEDTGAAGNQRVPCTLGYHFLQRDGVMDITYHIRSCDFIRHWRDDVYMAGRLLQWVCDHIWEEDMPKIKPGKLIMNISSFHIFEGDRAPLRMRVDELTRKVASEKSARLASLL